MVKTKKYKNGEVYVGKIRGGKREYYGHHHWPDKGDYVGEWSDDMMNGFGKYTWLDGRTFQGFFVNDMMCGRGCYQERNQTKEIFGEFTNGVLNGRGAQFTKTPDNKGYHVLVGTEFSSGKLIRGVEFILSTEGNEDKILELKQYKKNPSYVPMTNQLVRSSTRVVDVDASNSLPPQTPRVDVTTNASSMIEHVEFMEKQRYMDAKKEMQEKQKNIVLDFQNKLLVLEEKLKEEKQNAQYKTKCQQLEQELATHAQRAEEAKQLEQQLLQQVQQQRKLFEAFEAETHRHNKAMGDHINDLEQQLAQQVQTHEDKIKEQAEKFNSEMEADRTKLTELEQSIASLQKESETLLENHRTELEQIQQEKQQHQDELAEKQKLVEEHAQSIQDKEKAIEEHQKTIEDLNRTLQEHQQLSSMRTPRGREPSYLDDTSPRSPRISPRGFAKKLFNKEGDSEAPEFMNLRTKLSRNASQANMKPEGEVKQEQDGTVQIDFRSVLKNKVENKPDWIK